MQRECVPPKTTILRRVVRTLQHSPAPSLGTWAAHPRGVLPRRKTGSRKPQGHSTLTSTVLLLNNLLCQVYQIPTFFLKSHFLEACLHPSSPLPPGVSMPLFIHSVTFSRGGLLLSALTFAMVIVKKEQFVFWEHPQHSGVSPVAWSSWKSPQPPHITETLSFYLSKFLTNSFVFGSFH